MFSAVVVAYAVRLGDAGGGTVVNVPACDINKAVLVPPDAGTSPSSEEENTE